MSDKGLVLKFRELDKRAAEFRGYTDVRIYELPSEYGPVDFSDAFNPYSKCWENLPNYSREWKDAIKLLEEMAWEEDVEMKISRGWDVACVSIGRLGLKAEAALAPEAICRAYVAWNESGR